MRYVRIRIFQPDHRGRGPYNGSSTLAMAPCFKYSHNEFLWHKVMHKVDKKKMKDEDPGDAILAEYYWDESEGVLRHAGDGKVVTDQNYRMEGIFER